MFRRVFRFPLASPFFFFRRKDFRRRRRNERGKKRSYFFFLSLSLSLSLSLFHTVSFSRPLHTFRSLSRERWPIERTIRGHERIREPSSETEAATERVRKDKRIFFHGSVERCPRTPKSPCLRRLCLFHVFQYL